MQHGIHDNQILSNIYSIIFNKLNFGIIRYNFVLKQEWWTIIVLNIIPSFVKA